ncbi:MAG TPA: serine/threonine-protein kinase [Polyangia bacterium]|jgi:serine/threonine-protein kinase
MATDDDPPRTASETASDPVATLLAAGDHAGAAQLAVERGELDRAIGIYDRLWRFADALPLALRLDRRALAVRLALDLGDPRHAGEIAATIPRDAAAELTAASAAFAARGRHLDAGHLAERAGDRAAAATFYRRAGNLVDVGRLEEAAGRDHEAGVAYEQARGRAGSDDERAAADLALGRLLARLGRHEDAARAFQRAMRAPPFHLGAGRALIGVLLALGYPLAANEVAIRLRQEKPELPAALDEIAALEAVEAATGAFPANALGAPTAAVGAAAGRRFKVLRSLGAGATSQVYVAEDTLLGQEVALKLLAFGAAGGGAEGQAYARFAREAEAAGRLRHPNIVALHDADPAAGLFVWELMSGGALAERLADGRPLPVAAVRRLALDLLSALAAAHDEAIVHRDVKPANILFDVAGNAKLSDFGVAHLADFGQTQTGGLLGTVAYMSPEQITGGRIGPAADLYALAVTLFQCLTGRLLFQGPDVVAQHLGEAPQPPSELRAGLTDAHDAVLARALRKAPDERWESALEMREAIRRWPTEATDLALEPPVAAPGEAGPPFFTADLGELVPLGRSTHGLLFKRDDPRLGRPVLVERRDSPVVGAELVRLRALAALGGPHVQRVLALSDDDTTVTYELVDGPRAALAELGSPVAAALAEARAAVGADATSVVLAQGGPVLEVVGVPLEPASR